MNAPAKAMPHPTHKFRLLLRREFWEHKGGFLWAPLVAGGIFLLLSMMGLGIGEMAARRATGGFEVDGESVRFGGLDLSSLTSRMDAGDLEKLGHGIDASLVMASSWPFIVLAFVVFFYCLGTLYDDRKDRSVLFWKSLPVSDGETVLSKAASAMLVAPVAAVVAALLTMLGFLVVISGAVLLHGGNPFTLVWGPASPLAVAGQMIAMVPLYAAWALPTVGWLMLCSSWAKSKPFLWAIMIPVFAGIFVTWFDLMHFFDLEAGWFWKNIVGRALLSVAPASWMPYNPAIDSLVHGPESFSRMTSVVTAYRTFALPQMWIGAAAGAAMIFAAIRLRRWRDDN